MHLFKRHKTYYFKLCIPLDLQSIIGLKELRFSLKTKNKSEANHLAISYTCQYNHLFFQLRSFIYSDSEKVTLIRATFKGLLKDKPTQPLVTLRDLSEKYSNDKVITNTWADKTLKAYTFVFSVFSMIVNVDRQARAITRDDLQHFKATLVHLPVMKPNYLSMSIKSILALNQPPLNTSTAQKYLSYIVSFFKWLELEGYVDKSVATGLGIKDDENSPSSRVPYSMDDLKQLFHHSYIYTTGLTKALSEAPERIYMPLVAMYQGMRINEIAQLYTEDIRLIDGVYCIDINKNTTDKKLKNKSSARVIPIHRKLIELGFIDYVKSQRQLERKRLWEHLELGLEGYATNYRKWYGEFNRKYVTKDPDKTFHSFRHLFATSMKQISLKGDIDHYVIKYLLGHSVANDITMSVYTHGYNMKQLLEVLNKLDYKGLELDTLRESLSSYRG